MELVRTILLAIEASPKPYGIEEVRIEGRDGAEVSHHLQILLEAGMIQGIERTHMGSKYREWMNVQLTWSGHEFLDAARDQGVWTQAMTKVGGAVGSTSVAIVQAMLTKFAMQRLGLE